MSTASAAAAGAAGDAPRCAAMCDFARRRRPRLEPRPRPLIMPPRHGCSVRSSINQGSHMAVAKGNAVIGQSGGPTSVINQSLVGAVLEARKHGHIDRFLGARHGVRGIVDGQFIELNRAGEELLERIALTPAAALGSSRDKPDAAYCERIFQSFKKHNVRTFFYIGGNDSADTARIVNDLARQASYELRTFHIPKTIDNDLRVHDHTPGFGSAARFVASAIMGDDFDNRSLPGVKVDIIMGRNAGFLTAASVLARKYENDGPHLIYVPEANFSVDKFLADVDRVYKKLGRCVIAVSEGIHDENGTPMAVVLAEKLGRPVEKDSHGNVQLSGSGILGDFLGDLIKNQLKIKRVRSDTFGYLQRSFPGYTSETDAAEAREVGRQAVIASADEKNNIGLSVVMKRLSNSPYKIAYELTDIRNVARETKHLADEYISGGNDITQAFIDYARPLVGTLPAVGSFSELK
jgi:6-phosphofructokinase 1